MKQGVINTSVGALSAGTRVEIIRDNNKPWKKRGDAISSGYITVRLRTPPSHKLLDQGFKTNHDGTFDIEKNFITPLRDRFDLIDVRRTQKQILKDLTQKSQEYEGKYK